MKRKILTIIILVISLISLSSCYDYTEIEKEVFLFSLGIDKENSSYLVTAETLNSSDYGGSLNISPENIFARGNSVYEAIDNLKKKFNNKLNLNHLELIIIGEKLLKEDGLTSILNLVFSEYDLRYNTIFCTTFKDNAKDILTSQKGHETFHGFEILEQLNESGKFKNNIRAYKILNNIYDNKKENVIPVIKVSSKEEKKNFYTNKLAILEKDKLKGYIKEEDTKYFYILMGEKNASNLTVNYNDKDINLKIKPTKLTSKIQNNTLNININFDIYILDSHITNINKEKIKEKTKETIKLDLYNFILSIQENYKMDIFGFGYNLNNYNIRKRHKNWNSYFSTLNKDINIKVNLKDKLED